MNLIPTRKPAKKNIRDVVSNKRALNKAVKESINDQKKVTLQAAKLRAQQA